MNILTSELLMFILSDQLCSPGTPQDTGYMRYRLIIRNKSVLCHCYCFQLVVAQQAHSPNQCFPSKWLAEQFSTDNFYWFIVFSMVLVSCRPAASHRFVGHALFLAFDWVSGILRCEGRA